MSPFQRILLSRGLTRFGDQAWDFCLPLALVIQFPGRIDWIATYFLCAKLIQLFLYQKTLSFIDRWDRPKVFRWGIGSQSCSVLFSFILLLLLQDQSAPFYLSPIFLGLVLAQVLGGLGSNLMEISVGYDLAADLIPPADLARFNSRMKQIDLATEMGAPIFVGVLFSSTEQIHPLFGLLVVTSMNVVSFIPEYLLLRTCVNTVLPKQPYSSEPVQEILSSAAVFFRDLSEFKNSRYALVMFAYALLWTSALSPHGALLTAHLQNDSGLSPTEISLFRAGGALFGMLPTFLFPWFIKLQGLGRTTKGFLAFQGMMILFAALAFFSSKTPPSFAALIFLFFILLSRVGLYGFSIGESEVRQKFIPSRMRGRINGVGTVLCNGFTLLVLLAGSLSSHWGGFSLIVGLSTVAVLAASFLILFWTEPRMTDAPQN